MVVAQNNTAPSPQPAAAAKRLRASDDDGDNAIIGLNVAGKLYYCRKATLLGVDRPSYFTARFHGSLDPEVEYIDERGREVFFFDRDPVSKNK